MFNATIIIVTAFFMLRANWVCKKRLEIIDNNFDEYYNYLTFEEMTKKFWIWDIEKLRKPKA
jgi:hypothetical protein